MGFLDWFGGGQKSAAPSDGIPEMLRRPVEQGGPPAAPAADPFRLRDAPAASTSWLPPAPAYTPPQPQQQQGPWRTLNFSPPPADAPPPPSLQAQPVDGLSVANWQGEVKQQEEDKKAAAQKSQYFGDEGQYAPQEMSVEAYLNLPPRERAAVDANTALVSAAKDDIAEWSKQQGSITDQNYLSQVNEKFGDDGGSDTYAPRTMAVLNDLGLDLNGKDLDQYLNYSALVTADDLKGLAPGTKPSEDPRQQNAVAFADAATKRLSETLASGQTLLDSIRSTSDQGAQLFGKPATAAPLGTTNSALDADLQQAFDIFSQKQSQADLTPETVGGVYAELEKKYGVTPNEVAQYFDTRLQSNEYLNASGGDNITLGGPNSRLEYLSPQDFRSKFLKRGE